MIPSSGDVRSASMAVCGSGNILLAGDTPQTPLKVQTLGDYDFDYLKGPQPKLQKEQAFFNQPSTKSNKCITEISLRTIKPVAPSPTRKQTMKKPAVLFHSRRTQQEAEVCPFIPLIQNLPIVEQEVIVIEDKHTHADTKTASRQSAKVLCSNIRKNSHNSCILNCLKKDTSDRHKRHECGAYEKMTKVDPLNDRRLSRGCKAVQVSMRKQHILSSTDGEWVRDLNSEFRIIENTVQSRQYHECTVVDNRDTDTIVSDQCIPSELFPQLPPKHCRPCKRSCDTSENAESQPPSINYAPPKTELFKASCTVDLANADAKCASEGVKAGSSDECCASKETPVGLSEAFMNALLQVHEKRFLTGFLGRLEQIRFR
ncbi:hypothetical protein TcWFU_002085 [Taenia crassiceps]|uniref:Uncharacterized protein n=1 Tax=Taenia crassiceps TaxID=6207 RepID=A0ABR4QD64_9CEST